MYCSSCGKSLKSTKGVGSIVESSASVSPPDAESIDLGLSLNEPGSQTKKVSSSSVPLGNRYDRPMGFSDLRKKKEGTLGENFAHLLFGHLSQPSFIYV